jgi:outer membrane protein assembly factor BamB
MDPLALPLSCPCVKGHAQRQYEKLGTFLEKRLDRPVKVLFSDDLSKSLRTGVAKRIDLIIGKRSVVQFDARINNLPVRPVLMLTGKDSRTTLTGLIMVRKGDPARKLEDLAGYTILFGPPDCDEKFQAAAKSLHKAGIELPERLDTRPGCSDSVLEMLENRQKPMAAVISSYAAALLEGCGTIEKGAIRIIGETQPVPFVTAFFTRAVDESLAVKIQEALAAVRGDPDLLAALETKSGFVPLEDSPKPAVKSRDTTKSTGIAGEGASWLGWRGANRDGIVARLPARLPKKSKIVWSRNLTGRGLAGLAATDSCVIVADRDAADAGDLFLCLDARTGKELWKLEYATPGKIRDYGNSPRATPLIHKGKVYTLGGLGDLNCVNLNDGKIVWSRHLARDFSAVVPTWGYCASPLAVDGKLIVNPGAKRASVIALDCTSGKEVWRCPGLPPAYASFIAGKFGGVRQIVGYDEKSLGGWELETGKRIWTLVPPVRGDFNVPTPIDAGGRLILVSENNGTRLYDFDADGCIKTEPAAVNRDLAPDSSTPVLIGGRIVGCWNSLYCLGADLTLRTLWTGEDDAFANYASLIASPDRVLVMTNHGEILLVNATAEKFSIISRLRIFAEDSEVFSHPALVGSRIYLRDMSKIVCVDLSEE